MNATDKPMIVDVGFGNVTPADRPGHSSYAIDFDERDPARRFPVEVCEFDRVLRCWMAESARSQILIG